jgi:hypothetical protein
MEELGDDETAGSVARNSRTGRVGDALARAEIGDRGRASEVLRREKAAPLAVDPDPYGWPPS